MLKKILVVILLGAVAVVGLALLIQLIPVNRTNPPVVTQVKWDSPETAALFKRACADCHSNETIWPWYSQVAPVSWLVAKDVREGREKLNVSDLNGGDPGRLMKRIEEISEVIEEGEMPMPIYLPMHPEAKLTQAEASTLSRGLQKSLLDTIQ
jgi:mono/diheme cytochrome c family protein